MSSIRCSSCGHRILLPTTSKTCINCGVPLQSQSREQGSYMVSRQPVKTQISSQRRVSINDFEEEKELTALQPYSYQQEHATSLTSYKEEIPTIMTGMPEQRSSQVATPWAAEKLPRGFPRRSPDLMGTVINVQTQMETSHFAGTGGSFFKQFIEALWPLPYHERMYQEKEKIQVTTIRIRTSNGVQTDARLEGYLRRASISLGDTLSLWGKSRQGVLLVYQGYNHTSKGAVSTNSLLSLLPLLFLIIAGVVVLYWLVSRYNIPIFPQ